MFCTLQSVGIFFKYSPKRQRELEQCIVSVGDGGETVNESECGIDRNAATTDDDSDSENDEYESGEEESSEMEDEDVVELDSPKLKAAKQKIKPLCETRWVERHTAFQDFEDLHKPLLICLDSISLDKSRKKWIQNTRRRHRDYSIKSRVLCSLLLFTLRNIFLDLPWHLAVCCRVRH